MTESNALLDPGPGLATAWRGAALRALALAGLALLALLALPAQAQVGINIVSGNNQQVPVGGTSSPLVVSTNIIIGAPQPGAVDGMQGVLFAITSDGSGGATILRDAGNPNCFSSTFPGYCEVAAGSTSPAERASALVRVGNNGSAAITVRSCPAERVMSGMIWTGVRCIPGGFYFPADFTLSTTGAAPSLAVTTETAVTVTSTTLNGTVTPNGNTVQAYFEYRSYPGGTFIPTPATPVSGGSTAIPISAVVSTGCGSNYEYRVRANLGGTLFTSPTTRIFPTPACPPLPPQIGALQVSDITPTSARLDAGIVTNSAQTTVSYELRLATASAWTPVGSVVQPAAPQALFVSLPVSNLICARDYQFRVTAQNAGGLVGPSIPWPFTTGACVVTGLQATVAVTGVQRAGNRVTYTATVTGASGAVRYDWDVDGDGVIDRSGAQAALEVVYPTAFNGNATLTVTDASGASFLRAIPVNVAAPRLEASANGAASQVCGDGDALPEPGERWQLPLRVANEGTVEARGALVSLSPGDRRQATAGGEFITGAVTLDPPALNVGTLAAGAAVDRFVAVQLARSAACGTSYAIRQDIGVDEVSFGGGGRVLATLATPAAAQCQVYAGCVAAKASLAPRQGLYYDADRDGNGISNLLAQSPGGTIFFGAWFTGGADRKPTWNIVQGYLVDNQVVAPIYRFTKRPGTPFTVDRTVIGSATVTLLDAERLLFAWSIGARSGAEIMQYITPGPAAAPNRSGAWYAAAESGWGQVVSQFTDAGGANSTFVVHYLYDTVGEPRWVLAVEPTAALATGRPHITFPVHCPGCPFLPDWNSQRLEAGSASLVFSGARNARVSANFTIPFVFGGNWQRTDLPLEILTDPQ